MKSSEWRENHAKMILVALAMVVVGCGNTTSPVEPDNSIIVSFRVLSWHTGTPVKNAKLSCWSSIAPVTWVYLDAPDGIASGKFFEDIWSVGISVPGYTPRMETINVTRQNNMFTFWM